MATAPQSDAFTAWRSAFAVGAFEKAANVAQQAKLAPLLSRLAFHAARELALEHLRLGVNSGDDGSRASRRATLVEALRIEAAIACKAAPTLGYGAVASSDVEAAYSQIYASELLFPLLQYDCPMTREQRFRCIMAAARTVGKEDFALKNAERSRLSDREKTELATFFAKRAKCEIAFKAASQLGLDKQGIFRVIESSDCGAEPMNARAWPFPAEMFRDMFFESVRLEKYVLAIELSRLIGSDQTAPSWLVQEIFGKHHEYLVVKEYVKYPWFADLIYEYALARDRARFVGLVSKDHAWQERAFAELLKAGKFDDAAEVAEYGVSETLRTNGVLTAFRAAVAAGNIVDARYLWKRYPRIVPREEYEKAWAKHQKGRRFRKRRSACPLSDDWSVQRCEQ